MFVLHRLLVCCLSLLVMRSLAGFVGHQSQRSPSTLYYRDREASEEILTESKYSSNQYGSVATLPEKNLIKNRHSIAIADVTKNVMYEEDHNNRADDKELLMSSRGKNQVATQSIQKLLFSQIEMVLLATAFAASISLLTSVAGYHENAVSDLPFLHWNNLDYSSYGASFHSLFDWKVTNARVLEGILASIPMILLGNQVVEKSGERDASYLKFSMSSMVMDLFGRRRDTSNIAFQHHEDGVRTTSTTQVISLSFAIALSKALSEEIIFRGYIPTGIALVTHSIPLAFSTQAALFALGHVSLAKSTSYEEKKLTASMQFANGAWYGLVYLICGGDILPCILAHVLHDMHVFCASWTKINHQLDYTEQAFEKDLEKIQENERTSPPTPMTIETLKFARRFFYAFDHEQKGTLSLFDVQRAVNYAFLQDTAKPTPEDTQKFFSKVLEGRYKQQQRETEGELFSPNRLSVTEFLQVLFALRSSRNWAS